MLRYRFRDGVNVRSDQSRSDVVVETPYATRLNSIRQCVSIGHPDDFLKTLLARLSQQGVERSHCSGFQASPGFDSVDPGVDAALDDFYARGLLITEISGLKGCAICLNPLRPSLRQRFAPEAFCRIKFSKFVRIDPCRDGLEISTPAASGSLLLSDQRLFPLLMVLVSPCTEESIRQSLPEDLLIHCADLMSLLLTSGVAGVCDDHGVADIDQTAVESGWTEQDLAFHCHTRNHTIDLCRSERSPTVFINRQLPAKHQRIVLETVALPGPSRINHSLSFFQVIRDRQTVRVYQEQPITAGLLSDFLWHSMHIREEILCDPGLSRSYQGLLRPVAGSGALHSIELYLCVHRCAGLQPGFYHYDSSGHSLGKLSGLSEPCLGMLELAAASTCRAPQAASVSPGQGQQPDVLVVMAARYARHAALHHQTGLSYALILKDVGSIYQQLYLVATALGLAPCGLSFGSSELFEQASGLPSDLECSVGEFMIGNPA